MSSIFSKTFVLFSLLASLTACGNVPELAGVNPGGSGNGEGYPGGDDTISAFAGRFFYSPPGYKCRMRGSGTIASHKYEIIVDNNNRVTIKGNGCDDRKIDDGRSLHGLHFAPYNPHFLAKGTQMFTREGFTELDGEYLSVKGYCRKIAPNRDGFDVVFVQLAESKRQLALTYWQRRTDGNLDAGSLPPIPYTQTQTGSLRSIAGENLAVTIDDSIRYNKNRYAHGTVSLTHPSAEFEFSKILCVYHDQYK
ncbi:MAG TPA: hypothetical protein VFV50_15210 [Bdellovibrionales bacterium]|nr:hypothetical protein [Bdellovibrionales bacterium]